MSIASAPIEVAMCVDDGFVMPLAVTLASLDEVVGRSARPVRVWVVQPGLAERTKARIVQGLSALEVRWCDVDEASVAGAYFPAHLSTATLYRLRLGELLPASVSRVIYLDADTIVCDDLAPLYDTDLGGSGLGAVVDSSSPWCAGYWGPAWRELGLRPESAYFNAGVLLIDLAAWRATRVGERSLDLLRRSRPRWADQDALNVLYETLWRELPRRWNVQTADYTGVSPSWAVARAETELALKEPAIIHYHGVDKPWLHTTAHPAAGQWLATLDRTAWSGWRPAPPHETVVDRWAHATLRAARRMRARQRTGLPT